MPNATELAGRYQKETARIYELSDQILNSSQEMNRSHQRGMDFGP